jgi:uncharacterized protein YoxC
VEIIIGVVSAAITIIGFVTIWIKVGRNQGQMEEVIKNLVKQTEKNETDIAELRNGMHKIQIEDVARFLVIETKLDNIKETITSLNNRRRYAQKK